MPEKNYKLATIYESGLHINSNAREQESILFFFVCVCEHNSVVFLNVCWNIDYILASVLKITLSAS